MVDHLETFIAVTSDCLGNTFRDFVANRGISIAGLAHCLVDNPSVSTFGPLIGCHIRFAECNTLSACSFVWLEVKFSLKPPGEWGFEGQNGFQKIFISA